MTPFRVAALEGKLEIPRPDNLGAPNAVEAREIKGTTRRKYSIAQSVCTLPAASDTLAPPAVDTLAFSAGVGRGKKGTPGQSIGPVHDLACCPTFTSSLV